MSQIRMLATELRLGPYRIPVWSVVGLARSSGCDAQWLHESMEIEIDSRIKGIEWWSCLFHELTHAVAAMYSLHVLDRENICDTLGMSLAQALERLLPDPPKPEPLPPLGPDESTPAVVVKPVKMG